MGEGWLKALATIDLNLEHTSSNRTWKLCIPKTMVNDSRQDQSHRRYVMNDRIVSSQTKGANLHTPRKKNEGNSLGRTKANLTEQKLSKNDTQCENAAVFSKILSGVEHVEGLLGRIDIAE